MKEHLVSVVITTRNEEKNIEHCIQSILQQEGVPVEVIVVDNGSTDRTKDIARAYTEKVFDKGPERSAQRNYGMIDCSEGDFVMFVDADMILAPGILADAVKLMEEGEEEVKAMHLSEVVLGKKFFSKVRRFERSFYDTTPIDGARLFRKDAFVKVGGFDLKMSGPEDWDIDKKIKQIGKIGYVNPRKGGAVFSDEWKYGLYDFVQVKGIKPETMGEVIFHNEAEFDLKDYLKKKKYYVQSFDSYIQKWGKNDKDVRRQLGWFYRFFGVFIEKGKWIRLFRHPILTFGMYFLRFRVGWAFLTRRKRQKMENIYQAKENHEENNQ